VPIFLRTGKKLAEGARVISIAFKDPPAEMFRPAPTPAPTGRTT
jgi:glucose-6-phosphate 1-dehydrogenase